MKLVLLSFSFQHVFDVGEPYHALDCRAVSVCVVFPSKEETFQFHLHLMLLSF